MISGKDKSGEDGSNIWWNGISIMEKNVKITIGSLSTILGLSIITIISMLAGSSTEGPFYFCEEIPKIGIVNCDGFSKYVSPVGKCLNATTLEGEQLGNKICREGWKELDYTPTSTTTTLKQSDSDLVQSICGPLRCKDK